MFNKTQILHFCYSICRNLCAVILHIFLHVLESVWAHTCIQAKIFQHVNLCVLVVTVCTAQTVIFSMHM